MFLTAGHIKPWREANDKERLDKYNGLLLSPVYDKAFDLGYISFENCGTILISKKLLEDAKQLGISGKEKIENINPLSHKYLEFHRNNIFKQ